MSTSRDLSDVPSPSDTAAATHERARRDGAGTPPRADTSGRLLAQTLLAQTGLCALWALTALVSAHRAIATLPAGMDGAGWVDAAWSSGVAVVALAVLSLLLVLAGRRTSAWALPTALFAPALAQPLQFVDIPWLLSFGAQQEVLPVGLRLAALMTLAVITGPAFVLGRRLRDPLHARPVLRTRALVARLVLPTALALVAAAFDIVDPNGPGATRWPVLATAFVAGALLTTGRLPRRFTWPAVVAVTLLAFSGWAPAGLALAGAAWTAYAPLVLHVWTSAVRRPRPVERGLRPG